MTPFVKTLRFATILAAASFAAHAALAQKAPAAVEPAAGAAATAQTLPIAVLDMAQVRHNSAAGKAADQQLNALRTKYKQEIAKSEEQLRAEYDALGKQRSVLSPEAFEEKGRAFEKKQQEAQRLLQARNTAMEGAMRDAEQQIGKVTLQIVTELMKDRNISLVIDSSQMVASATSIEITGDVLTQLNKVLPTVKVTAPEPPEKASKAKK